MTYLLTINRHVYAVPNDGMGVVQGAILAAVRGSGAFVTVPHRFGGSAQVLITSASQVSIHEMATPPEASPTDDYSSLDIAFLDLDQ
jgi:hypothetical protein